MGRRVARQIGARFLPEAFERLEPPLALVYRSRRELLDLELALAREESRRFVEAQRWRDRGRTVVMDTGPIGPLAYAWGLRAVRPRPPDVVGELALYFRDALAAGRWGLPDLTLYLEAPPSEVRARVAADPIGHPRELAARHAAVDRRARALWLGRFGRAAPGRFDRVRADAGPGEVVRRLVERIRGAPIEPAPTGPDALRVLSTVRSGPADRRRRPVAGNR